MNFVPLESSLKYLSNEYKYVTLAPSVSTRWTKNLKEYPASQMSPRYTSPPYAYQWAWWKAQEGLKCTPGRPNNLSGGVGQDSDSMARFRAPLRNLQEYEVARTIIVHVPCVETAHTFT